MNSRSVGVNSMLEKRTKILKSTEYLLASGGLDKLSMKRVALKSGVATGTIYLYFKSKSELVQELHQQNLLKLAEFLFDKYDDKQTVKDRFLYLWHRMWEFGLLHPDSILCKPEFEKLPELIQKQEEEYAKQLFQPLGEVYADGLKHNLFRKLPIEVLVAISFEPCSNLLRRQLIGQLDMQQDQLNEAALSCYNAILIHLNSE